MSGEPTSAGSPVDEIYCVGCSRSRPAEEQGWVVVRGSSTFPRAAYCPDCMTTLVRDASGMSVVVED